MVLERWTFFVNVMIRGASFVHRQVLNGTQGPAHGSWPCSNLLQEKYARVLVVPVSIGINMGLPPFGESRSSVGGPLLSSEPIECQARAEDEMATFLEEGGSSSQPPLFVTQDTDACFGMGPPSSPTVPPFR